MRDQGKFLVEICFLFLRYHCLVIIPQDIDGGNFLLPNLLHYVPQLEVNLPSTAPQLTVFIID